MQRTFESLVDEEEAVDDFEVDEREVLASMMPTWETGLQCSDISAAEGEALLDSGEALEACEFTGGNCYARTAKGLFRWQV